MSFQPSTVDFLQGDFLGFIERFNEPNVFVNLVFGPVLFEVSYPRHFLFFPLQRKRKGVPYRSTPS